MKKKFFSLCYIDSNTFLFKVAAKLASTSIKEATKKEDADILFLDLKSPGSIFEENFERLDGKPAIILSTQDSYYNRDIKRYLKVLGIEENKIIITIPTSNVVEEIKEAIIKLLS